MQTKHKNVTKRRKRESIQPKRKETKKKHNESKRVLHHHLLEKSKRSSNEQDKIKKNQVIKIITKKGNTEAQTLNASVENSENVCYGIISPKLTFFLPFL